MLTVSLTPRRGLGAWQRKMERARVIERFDISVLRDDTKRQDFVDCIKALLDSSPVSDDINKEWIAISEAVQSAGTSVLGKTVHVLAHGKMNLHPVCDLWHKSVVISVRPVTLNNCVCKCRFCGQTINVKHGPLYEGGGNEPSRA